MTALVVPRAEARVVTRAKKAMSAFMRGQGSVPFRPMPRRTGWVFGVCVESRIGVVATISVSGVAGCGGGILDEGRWFLVFWI